MSGDSDERIYPASPRRRKEAIERGDVVTSGDVTSALLLLLLTALATWFGTDAVMSLAFEMRDTLATPAVTSATEFDWSSRLQQSATAIIAAVSGIALTAFAAVLAGDIVQSGWNFSFPRIVPDLGKLAPERNLLRIITAGNPLAMLSGLLRWAVAGGVLGLSLWSHRGWLHLSSKDDPGRLIEQTNAILTRSSLQLAAVLLLTGIVHYAWRWRRRELSLRMTAAELREEQRQSGGRRWSPPSHSVTPVTVHRDAG